jgi:hypothetical protein
MEASSLSGIRSPKTVFAPWRGQDETAALSDAILVIVLLLVANWFKALK